VKKIPTLFERDWAGDRSRVTREVNPECAWVLAGEGVPTRKWDGTAVLVADGLLYKRYERKGGRPAPGGFIAAQEPDPVTGDAPGWLPVIVDDPSNRWLLEATDPRVIINGVAGVGRDRYPAGTYELVGPKVNGNPDGADQHTLVKHGAVILLDTDGGRSFDSIRAFLEQNAVEGIVWHHPDGRMAKVKRRDFGLAWPVATP